MARKTYKTKQLDQEDCPRYGLHATRPGEQFDFCTATKGYADFDDHGANVVCHQITVPEDYLGHWALVPEKSGACNPDEGPAEVTTDNIQTYHEDYCSILDAKEMNQPSDPHVEITCISGGEGGSETKTHETWRLRNLLGKQIFIEQGVGGLLFWQRCP